MPDDRSEPREWEVGASAGACFFLFPYHHPRRPWRHGIFGEEFSAELGVNTFHFGKTFPPFQDLKGF